MREHPLVGGELGVHQCLVQPLPGCRSERLEGEQYLADGGVGREAPALSAREEQELAGFAEPVGKRRRAARGAPCLCQKMRGAAARTELAPSRIARREPLRLLFILQRGELARHRRREGQEMLNHIHAGRLGGMLGASPAPNLDIRRGNSPILQPRALARAAP